MSDDHYVSYLAAEVRELRAEAARQTARGDRLQRILDAVIERVHPNCTSDVCSTIAAIEGEL